MTFGHQQTWESGFNSVFRKMKSLLGLGDYLKQEFMLVCAKSVVHYNVLRLFSSKKLLCLPEGCRAFAEHHWHRLGKHC